MVDNARDEKRREAAKALYDILPLEAEYWPVSGKVAWEKVNSEPYLRAADAILGAADAVDSEQLFPRYLMIIDGKRCWLTLREAGVAYDSGWMPVSIGGIVMEDGFAERDVTDGERERIAEIADEYSASK